MHPIRHVTGIRIKRSLWFTLLVLSTCPAIGSPQRHLPVNIFGDGDPANGIEDSRRQLFGSRWHGIGSTAQPISAGTIRCDGRIRGTAMVLDTRADAPALKGAILATAAHVLYDLDNKQLFKRCEFHYLALGQLKRYRARIDLKHLRLGEFDPSKSNRRLAFGHGDWAFVYVPRPWVDYDPARAVEARAFKPSSTAVSRQQAAAYRLIAFDAHRGVITISNDCKVMESQRGDLGGGAWPGQLLDDCDSSAGSSGGGIVLYLDNNQYLIGIRGGSHWSAKTYPVALFPSGPPDGSVWNRQANTNFGRAIDQGLLEELRRFVQTLSQRENAL